ncbi:MAG TPA: MDR family MFS transporter [Bacillales bacterium]|nr:MDR family MFS transporter [Bacillales bacterium]
MRKVLSEKWLVVISVLLGAFTLILNNSMMNPALPYFEQIFHADAVSVSWILTIFMVTMGMAMPLTGYLSEKIGKKNLFMIGLALFATGSIAGSFAWSLGSIIFFRAVQGAAGGVMIPLAMALIFEVFPRHERGMAMGVYGIAAMVAPTIGPTLGGFIIENASWRYLFLANVPTGILGLIMCAIYMKRPARNPDKQFDYKGFVAVTLGIGTMLFAFSRMQTVAQLTNPVNIALVIFGLLCLVLFVWLEKHTSDPLLNLDLFRTPAFSLAVWISSIGTIGLFASIFLLPFLIQSVYGYSAVATGLVLLPSAVFTGIFMNIGGRILDKKGPTAVVSIGLSISALMMFLFFFVGLKTPLWIIVFLMALRGMGMGFTNMPANTTGMNSIPDPMVAQGSAMNNVVRRMASALGVVFISVFFQVRKTGLVASGESVHHAAMVAINEAYLIVGILTFLTIPAGILLGIKSRQGSGKKGKVASVSS